MTHALIIAAFLGFILGFLWLVLNYWYVFAGAFVVATAIAWITSW